MFGWPSCLTIAKTCKKIYNMLYTFNTIHKVERLINWCTVSLKFCLSVTENKLLDVNWRMAKFIWLLILSCCQTEWVKNIQSKSDENLCVWLSSLWLNYFTTLKTTSLSNLWPNLPVRNRCGWVSFSQNMSVRTDTGLCPSPGATDKTSSGVIFGMFGTIDVSFKAIWKTLK